MFYIFTVVVITDFRTKKKSILPYVSYILINLS